MPIADIDYREYYRPQRITQISEAFTKYDSNEDGLLNESELYAFFKKMGKSLSRQQLRELMKGVASNSSGELDFEELCVLEIKMSRARPCADLIDYRDYLDAKTIRQLEQLFVQHDPFGQGTIGVAELQKIVKSMGGKVKQEFLEEVLSEIITDASAELEFEKLAALWAVVTKRRKCINYREFLSAKEVEELRKTFDRYDSQGEGCITVEGLAGCLSRFGWSMGKNQLNELVKHFDTDGSGTIDFEEFCVMVLRLKGLRRKRAIGPGTCKCGDLWNNENFTIKELQLSGFHLRDFKKVGIPVSRIYKEGHVSALEFRQAGYEPAELRRGGMPVGELRKCGYSLTALRQAGFSDAALTATNRAMYGFFSTGDLSQLPQQKPKTAASPMTTSSSLGQIRSSKGISPRRCMTPMIREHTDWRPRLARNDTKLMAAGAEMVASASVSNL